MLNNFFELVGLEYLYFCLSRHGAPLVTGKTAIQLYQLDFLEVVVCYLWFSVSQIKCLTQETDFKEMGQLNKKQLLFKF